MTKKTISIFWPDTKALDVEEFLFSYSFCYEKSKAFCLDSDLILHWIDYSPITTMFDIIKGVETDFLLMVSDPEIIISSRAISALINSDPSFSSALGPVFNLTEYPAQQALLPAPYLNTSMFDEMLLFILKHGDKSCETTHSLDPSCILFPAKLLKDLEKNQLMVPVIDFLNSKFSKKISKRALVHRFGNYYDGERPDLVELVPEEVMGILDVGTAMGGYGRELKRTKPDRKLTGVEMNPLMASIAGKYYDRIYVGKIEDASITEQFDLINCGDVVEHVYDPQAMFGKLFALVLIVRLNA